jgi:hypothetical protein
MIGLCILLAGGCGGSGGRPNKDTLSPAEYFNQTQGNTMTPHGRVRGASAQDAGSGKVRYQTEDGKKWEVTATPNGKGYRYSAPKAVE